MTKKKINVEIGKRIHIARERNHYTQEVLSEKLDLTTQYLSDVERGASGISISTLIKLCKILNVSSDYILFGDSKNKTLDENIRLIKRMSKAEQELINKAINTTIEALTIHEKNE